MQAKWYVKEQDGLIIVSKAWASCLATDLDRILRSNGKPSMYTNASTADEALDIYKKLRAAEAVSPCRTCDLKADFKCGWKTRSKCKPYISWYNQVFNRRESVKPQTSPCKDCNSRAVGCHGLCEKYADWARRHTYIRMADQQDYVNSMPEKRKKYSHLMRNSVKQIQKGV